ncbi:MAG: alpha/beta hydrolase [Acidimicrobiales bacterium]
MVVKGGWSERRRILGELVSIPTEGAPLDGLYYEPRQATRAAALIMHGNGQNFYTGPARFLVPHLVDVGIACLCFNRRGHDTISCRTREPEGNAYQTVAEARADIAAARGFLAEVGHSEPVVIGHSHGALLAASDVAEARSSRGLVLLSAHCGGKELLARASLRGLLAKDRVAELSARAHLLVAKERPDELILLPGWWYAISAGSLVDLEENLPDLLEVAPRVSCPVLAVRGDEDPVLYPAEAFAALTSGPAKVVVIEGADHFYTSFEDELAAVVARWLDDVLDSPALAL